MSDCKHRNVTLYKEGHRCIRCFQVFAPVEECEFIDCYDWNPIAHPCFMAESDPEKDEASNIPPSVWRDEMGVKHYPLGTRRSDNI